MWNSGFLHACQVSKKMELPIFFLIPRLLLPISSNMLLGVLTRIYFHQKEILLIRDMVVECWIRQHHGQTIHPIENLIPLNLFTILCVVTWAWLFLTSKVMEAVRGQKQPSEAKNGMIELILLKEVYNKSFSTTSKNP